MTTTIHKLPSAQSLDSILDELDLDPIDTSPGSIHLAPGETIHDRAAHHWARGREKAAHKRREAFRVV